MSGRILTIVGGKLDGSIASNGSQTNSSQNCADLTGLTTPAHLTVTWKGDANGAIGTTTFGGKASFTPSAITSGGEEFTDGQLFFPTSSDPRDPVIGSFAGGATAFMTTQATPSSLAPLCDTKATGGKGKGVKKVAFGGTLTVGLSETSSLNDAVTMASDGHQSYCAVLTTGGVQCWGDNANGELGDGTTTSSSVAESVSTMTDATAVASDGAHSYCAIVGSGAISCWGSNASGQLGHGTITDSSVPVAVTGITGATAISGDGDGSYCAVLGSGDVDCWGANASGELGDGMTTASSVPVAVTDITTAVAITGDSADSYCALLQSGDVDCWGAGSFGQLGDGSTTNALAPTAVTGLAGVTDLSSDGDDSFCAVSSGTVDCWGANFSGELGNGTTTRSTVPVAATGITGASAVSNDGTESYCALLSSGTAACWGYDAFGQLGDGMTTNSTVPVTVTGLTGATTIVSDGEDSYCAVVGFGAVDCWGANSAGELGTGTLSSSSTPVAVSGMSSAVNLVGADNAPGDSERSYCAVVGSGGVECWGSNGFGQLGNATTTDSSVPVTVVEP